ncbi:adenosylcobalamin-dependent ribonucleoside-diphosphate reductase [Azorhizophilus paspali]|uniref:adenosylcobalamin-dependent ribonucleoside-diphosphate reductase n=1 Tax=Azorhizophilus paspali TaxID=69963 RepID=UPI0036267F96
MAKHGEPLSQNLGDIPLQAASEDIWAQKYRLIDPSGTPVDADIDATRQRIAHALAEIEREDIREHWYRQFLWALRNGAIPAGRIVANAGAQVWRPATSTINCTVSGTLHDAMDDILAKLQEAGLTLKAGCGIGYEFSTLRPHGAFVSGAGARTSGPLSFMDIFDRMCFTVSSAGGRRGAQMATFDAAHPDVREFIRAKREDGRLRQFNLSLLITDEFMQAVENDAEWPLVFPVHPKEAAELDLGDPNQVLWRDWPLYEDYPVRDDGKVACRVYGKVRARHLWDMLMVSTYDFAEPGFILIDRVNQSNNNWWCEEIRATNPCGEQPLPPYGSCLLGSVNLTVFVEEPFTARARFDWERFRQVVRIFTRLLDNVVEINNLPLQAQRREILDKRRHGMGFLGLGSALTLLRLRYGSPEACVFTEEVAREMALVGWQVALELARKRARRRCWRRSSRSPRRCSASARRWPPTATRSAIKSLAACCTRATRATCSAWPNSPPNSSPRWPNRARASPTTHRSRRPAPSA